MRKHWPTQWRKNIKFTSSSNPSSQISGICCCSGLWTRHLLGFWHIYTVLSNVVLSFLVSLQANQQLVDGHRLAVLAARSHWTHWQSWGWDQLSTSLAQPLCSLIPDLYSALALPGSWPCYRFLIVCWRWQCVEEWKGGYPDLSGSLRRRLALPPRVPPRSAGCLPALPPRVSLKSTRRLRACSNPSYLLCATE